MNHARLRVYYGPEPDSCPQAAQQASHESVTLPLGEILPLLVDAAVSQRTWLRDFNDDPVTITNDLYEVILAYQHFRRPSA